MTCVPAGNGSKKTIMQAVAAEDANTSEYVYIMAETNSRGFSELEQDRTNTSCFFQLLTTLVASGIIYGKGLQIVSMDFL